MVSKRIEKYGLKPIVGDLVLINGEGINVDDNAEEATVKTDAVTENASSVTENVDEDIENAEEDEKKTGNHCKALKCNLSQLINLFCR